MNFIQSELNASCSVLTAAAEDAALLCALDEIIHVSVEALRRGNRLYFAGNGGSAADAQHFAAELVSRFYYDRPGLPAEALTTDTSIITAISNDYGFDHVFARQLEAKGREGDVFIGITTSGASENIRSGLQTARDLGLVTVAFTGAKGRGLAELCNHLIVAPSENTPNIQEVHAVFGHILCAAIERALYPQQN